jgi:ATP-dependent helicase YprA (DUF1998 family)
LAIRSYSYISQLSDIKPSFQTQAYIGLGNVAFYYRKNIEGLVYYHKAYQLQKMDNNVTAKKAFVQRDIKKRGFDRLSPDEIGAIKFFFQNC